MTRFKLQKIVSGGQTGADRAGLDVAIQVGIPHGGWCPAGRRAEDGKIPPEYKLEETPNEDYPTRTEWNIRDSDGTVIFTLGPLERGSALTARTAVRLKKCCVHLDLAKLDDDQAATQLHGFLVKNGIKVLNVAGNRESKSPGIGNRVTRVLLFTILKEADHGNNKKED